jgi:hypothetical protein
MTTILQERTRTSARTDAGYFYVYMAAACAAIAILGFAPTYWLPFAGGNLKASPIIHIHATVFFVWSLFFVFQTWLAASGRIAQHRSVGFIGVSLATLMTIFGALAAINSLKLAASLGLADAGKSFIIIPLASITFFAIVVALAIANVRQPETHKRLMLLAAVSILDAPIARWFMTFLAPPGPPGPPPVIVDIPPAILASMLLAVAIVFDWRTRGRPHAVYIVGGTALLAIKVLQIPLSATTAWLALAGWILALAQ